MKPYFTAEKVKAMLAMTPAEELAMRSEGSPSKSRGPIKVVDAVPTGSLPAFEVNNLAHYWEEMKEHWNMLAGKFYKQDKPSLALECEARAETYDICAKGLRGHMACAMKRQPEENTGDVERRGQKTL